MGNIIYKERTINLPADLKIKIKESLTNKKIKFTDEEKGAILNKKESENENNE